MLIITSLIPPEVDADLSHYETYRQELNYAVEFMPEINSLGEYEELRFGYQKTLGFLFVAETMSLTVKYSEAEYASVKDRMLASYDFIDTPIIDKDGDILLDDSFTHQGYVFQSIPMLHDMYSSCEYFGLLGINDELYCIAWLYYDDVDRDYIAASGENPDEKMRSLIDDEFHWEPFTK